MIDIDLKNKVLKILPEYMQVGTAYNSTGQHVAFIRVSPGVESELVELVERVEIFIPYECIEKIFEDLKRAKDDIDTKIKKHKSSLN